MFWKIMTKGVIVFDLDGVLVDSKEAHAEAFRMAFEANGLEKINRYILFENFGLPRDVIIRKLKPDISSRKILTVAKSKDDFLVDNTFKLAKPIVGVPEALAELKKDWKLAIISNTQHGEIYVLLRAAGIPPKIFDAILGADDIRFPKPNPLPIKKVEEVLGEEVEYVVGDQTYDIKMGRAAEKKTIAVLSGIDSREKLSAEDPDIIVRSVALLPEIL